MDSADSTSMGVAWDTGLERLASPPSLLQSWGHGEVQAREGWIAERVVLPGSARASVLIQGVGVTRWGYVPRGPVPASERALLDLVAWARARGLARLRVEPEAPLGFGEALARLGFERAPDTQPRHTLLVPLRSEDQMLASFKPKHRYNIRLASKRGVEVVEGEDAEELVRHTQATAHRKGISQPRLEQFRQRLRRLAWCRVYVARHQGRSLAAILVARFAGRAYYLFGGATGEASELKPSYAVQWSAIRAAAEAGCRDYDLWGVPPAPDPGHPWFGLWQIKTGFGGRLVEYCGAWELTLSEVGAALGRTAMALKRAGRRLLT